MPLRSSLATVLVVAACGGASGGQRDDETSRRLVEASRRCPVAELDAAIVVDDLPDGATIMFTTGGQPQRLRAKVFEIADTHNEVHSEMGPLPEERPDEATEPDVPDARDASARDTARGDATFAAGIPAAAPEVNDAGPAMIAVHSRARPEEVPGGARIVFIADRDDVEELRDELRDRADEIAAACEIR